ncbi:MAG TPA: hypothetical protein VFH68_11685 [Polyangia bacterium]|nr:hypothetical protein [Polyangia bacterium]
MALVKSALFVGVLSGSVAVGAATAQARDIAAGTVFAMTEDLVLSGAENLAAGADSGGRCTIQGNGHTIRSADGWTGSLNIKNCDVDHLGAENADAINVHGGGTDTFTITGTTFATSGQLLFFLSGARGMVFQRNLIAEDSVVSTVVLLASSAPAIFIKGTSDADKLFQGNVMRRSRVEFNNTNRWTIGGTGPGEGNIFVGTRAGADLEVVDTIKFIGNYSHTTIPENGWNQVKNLTGRGSNVVVQHNVVWGYNWLLELTITGEVSYNLLIDNIERGWTMVRDKAGTLIHHNVMIATKAMQNNPEGVFVVDLSDDQSLPDHSEVFNNTFQGGGVCVPAIRSLVVLKGAYLTSLRSNAFVDARVGLGADALIYGGPEGMDGGAQPPGLGYSDYNLFYVPDSPRRTLYTATVTGKAPGEPGYGAHDVDATSMPRSDRFTIPLFNGKVPRSFPFMESEVISRQTTVCQILAYYRQVFTPVASAGMLGAGDPADGANNSIGAIGVGAADPADLFGRAPSCDATDIGNPATDASVFTCKPVPAGGSASPDDLMAAHGFQCVCELGAGRQDATPLIPILALAGVALAARRHSRSRL